MRVLTVSDYFLPGYRAGGPVRSIVNMVETLGDEFEFLIVTRDRDLRVSEPYTNVCIDEWNELGKIKVFYASPEMFSLHGFKKIFYATPHDVLYLNSFFSKRATILILLLRLLGFIKPEAVVIAPRGEFSPGALRLKSARKRAYIQVVRLLRLYQGLIWQASSEREAQDISNVMGPLSRKTIVAPVIRNVLVAPNLISASTLLYKADAPRTGNKAKNNSLRLVFLSRISPMKNLDYLLRILQKASVPIDFSIYGPLEDAKYWAECERVIQELPTNILVHYRGEVTPEAVPSVFAEQDVFFFPTLGENFGHVIFESLSAGTCVVLSDKTPWASDEKGAVDIIPLEHPEAWLTSLERWASRSPEELAKYREAALAYANEYVSTSPAVEQNRALFQFAYIQAMAKH